MRSLGLAERSQVCSRSWFIPWLRLHWRAGDTTGNPVEILPALGFVAIAAAEAVATCWAEQRFLANREAPLSVCYRSFRAAIVTLSGLPVNAIDRSLTALSIAGTIITNMAFETFVAALYARKWSGVALAVPDVAPNRQLQTGRPAARIPTNENEQPQTDRGASEHRVKKPALAFDRVTPALRDVDVGVVKSAPIGMGGRVRPSGHVTPRHFSQFGVHLLKHLYLATDRWARLPRQDRKHFVKRCPALVGSARDPQPRMTQFQHIGR